MTKFRNERGKMGEGIAGQYLENLGWKIIARNWRCRAGELDIVAVDGRTLVFVEVRTRSSDRFGSPEESVDWRKQRQVRKVALHYLQTEEVCTVGTRFDMISVRMYGSTEPEIRHIRHAF